MACDLVVDSGYVCPFYVVPCHSLFGQVLSSFQHIRSSSSYLAFSNPVRYSVLQPGYSGPVVDLGGQGGQFFSLDRETERQRERHASVVFSVDLA